MITKQQFTESMTRECDICIHLFSKLPPGSYHYQPSPDQRTTAFLLRYLAICGIAGLRAMAESNWKLFGEYSDRVREMPPEDFPATMQRQKKEIEDYMAALSETALEEQEAPLPGGSGSAPLGMAILNGPLKWLTAYKMQLFLYAKASGAPQLKTANLWRGVDPAPK